MDLEENQELGISFSPDTGLVPIRTPAGTYCVMIFCGDYFWSAWDIPPRVRLSRPTEMSDDARRLIRELRNYFKTGSLDLSWFALPNPFIPIPEEIMAAFVYLKDFVKSGQLIKYKELTERFGVDQRVLKAYLHYNRWPVVVPCHRVIRSDGRMGGYWRGHAEKKYWLLRLEGIRFKGDPYCDPSPGWR